MDNKLILVALDGLDNLLRVGEDDKDRLALSDNQYAIFVEEAGGMDKIHDLQGSENVDLYKKAYHLIDKYFTGDEDNEDLAPELDATTGNFAFPADTNVPQGGFSFGQ